MNYREAYIIAAEQLGVPSGEARRAADSIDEDIREQFGEPRHMRVRQVPRGDEWMLIRMMRELIVSTLRMSPEQVAIELKKVRADNKKRIQRN